MLRLDKLGGSGPDLVLLPGWASDGRIFTPLFSSLMAYFTLHLASWREAEWVELSPKAFKQQIIIDLTGQLPDQSILVGWSLGGLIAVNLAHHSPHKVKSLMTLAFNPSFIEQSDWSCAMSRENFASFQRAYAKHPKKTLREFSALQLLGETRRQTVQRQLLNSRSQLTDKTQLRLLALLQEDARSMVQQLVQPQCYCYGTEDVLAPSSSLIAEASLLNPSIETRSYQGSAHLPFLSAPSQWLKDLIDWCDL